ncbi:MAG: class I SAM-dependent methyltransferase [Pseudomonadota bacterium]|nr:class I SAM-dependent methyltransferase [Pseudomonadota bacterium]
MSPNTADEPSSAPSDDYPSLKPKNAVSRNQVVQGVLDLFEAPDYLEVGVNRGVTFRALKAATKVAVDPKFLFDFEAEASANVHFHETTSDDYFGQIATPGTAFDVIYLDGLHTSEQTIRDLVNAFAFLKHDGVIVIDDVFPSSYIASLPERQHTRVVRQATADPSGAWMGDVFRLVFFVETFCQQYSYATVNNNHGQLVLWREPRASVLERTLRQVSEKDYKDLFLERDTFCFAPLASIVERIRASRSGA